MSTIVLTIQQLYDRVWAEPVSRIASELGLSDRGLGKLCRRHKIPVPERGYWRRKETGHTVRQALLPRSIDPHQTIVFDPADTPTTSDVQPADTTPLHPLIAFEREPANRIIVDERIRLSHPLIRSTRAFWQSRAETQVGEHPAALNLRVSKEQRTRALRIMQTLIAALEQREFGVTITKDRKTTVTVLGEPHEVRIFERSRNVPHVRTPQEQKWGWSPKYDSVATGLLVFEIERAYWSRHVWTDGKRRQLEDCLNEIVESLVEAALIDKKHREDRERESRERQERERRAREEQERIAQLDKWLARWKRAEEIKRFVGAARQALSPVEPGSETDAWFQWVDRYVRTIDPFSGVQAREPTPVD